MYVRCIYEDIKPVFMNIHLKENKVSLFKTERASYNKILKQRKMHQRTPMTLTCTGIIVTRNMKLVFYSHSKIGSLV